MVKVSFFSIHVMKACRGSRVIAAPDLNLVCRVS